MARTTVTKVSETILSNTPVLNTRVFKTGCYGRPNEEFHKFGKGESKSLTRPEMSFTIEEIKKRFTLQTLAYEANAANPQFMLPAESDDFDVPAVNITENYDILDARSATHDALRARMEYLSAIRASRKTPGSDPDPSGDGKETSGDGKETE